MCTNSSAVVAQFDGLPPVVDRYGKTDTIENYVTCPCCGQECLDDECWEDQQAEDFLGTYYEGCGCEEELLDEYREF